MKRLHTFFVLLFCLGLTAAGQEGKKTAYGLFTADGKPVEYGDMLRAVAGAEILFFGELHNDPITHWLQLELTEDLYEQHGDRLVLAAEMFERDNQLILDEYLGGIISNSRFEAEVRLWNNYKTDYKPLVEFARAEGLHFVASNIPRRYASLVASRGFGALDSLSIEAKKYIAPLPPPYDPELECYKSMLTMGGMPGKRPNEHFPKAQAIKDATMGWSVVQALGEDGRLIHFNGSYHSDNHQGIVWYIEQYRPGSAVMTLTTVLQEEVSQVEKENLGKADFIIVVPASMTRTY